MYHCQGESRGYCGVDGIAAALQDFHAGTRRQFVHAHHNRMCGMNRVNRRRGGNRSARHH